MITKLGFVTQLCQNIQSQSLQAKRDTSAARPCHCIERASAAAASQLKATATAGPAAECVVSQGGDPEGAVSPAGLRPSCNAKFWAAAEMTVE